VAEDGVTDELLGTSVELGTDIECLFEIGRALTFKQANSRSAVGIMGDEADIASVSRHAAGLARAASSHGIPMAQALRMINTIAQRIAPGEAEPRARAIIGLLRDFAAFGDWAGADSMMKVFGAERELPAPEFADGVGAFLGRLRDRGEDLYRGIACLCAAQDTETGEPPDNRDLLRRATERLETDRA
jgi:hypothetical protein